jgi:hypothetical protein
MEYDPFGIQPAFRDGFYCLEIKDQELSLRRVEYQYFDSIFSFDTSPGLRHTFYPDYSIYHSPYDDGRTYYHHIIRNDSIWVISGMPQNSGIIHRYARSSGDTLATSSFNADEWYTIRCRTLKATTGYLPFNVILYKIQGFWGVHTHSFTLPAQFDTVLTAWRNEHGSFFSVIKNGRCGLMGQDMKWMVEPNYDSIKLLNSQDQSFLLFKDDMVHLYLGSEQQVISGNFSEIKILDYQDFSYIISEKGTYRLCTKDPNGRSVSPAFQHIPKEILIIEDLILYKLYDENNRYLGLAGEWGTLYFSD